MDRPKIVTPSTEMAIDYNQYFCGRVFIITGVGRSGTTILGKLIGSMEPAFYLFEPAIMKYCIWMCIPELAGVLFEDYFLPMVQGRYLNFNEKEDSCIYHYQGKTFNEFAWNNLNNKKSALKYIESIPPLWVIKTNEIAPWAKTNYEICFPGVKFLHIIRNGNDVIGSALQRGWYSDQYMEKEIVDFVSKKETYNCPWYLSEEDKQNWRDWNQVTRCACIWRTLVETIPTTLTYESLLEKPERWVQRFSDEFNLGITHITGQHIKSIKKHSVKSYPDFLPLIEEPEKGKYQQTMKKFGYL